MTSFPKRRNENNRRVYINQKVNAGEKEETKKNKSNRRLTASRLVKKKQIQSIPVTVDPKWSFMASLKESSALL